MIKPANHRLLNLSASAEWFTPPQYIQAVREVLGRIDLDPASCEAAKENPCCISWPGSQSRGFRGERKERKDFE
jgi:hypothetical protein